MIQIHFKFNLTNWLTITSIILDNSKPWNSQLEARTSRIREYCQSKFCIHALCRFQLEPRFSINFSDSSSRLQAQSEEAFRYGRSTSMSCSVCATRPLRWFLASLGGTPSAVPTSRRLHGARGQRSINTSSGLRNLPESSHDLNSPQYLGQKSFDVASIPNADTAVRGNCVGINSKKFGLRDGPRVRASDVLKGVPRSGKRSVEASDFIRFERREREPWQIQKSAMSKKFGSSGWSPRKRLSPDSLEGIRSLHVQYPDRYTTPVLAEQFKVSPEAIRRILKSKWRPNDGEEDDRRERWNKRGVNIWGQMNELGIKPPKKWRDQGVGKFGKNQPAMHAQFGPSNRATGKLWFETDRSGGSHSVIPAVRRVVDQVPLADRIL